MSVRVGIKVWPYRRNVFPRVGVRARASDIECWRSTSSSIRGRRHLTQVDSTLVRSPPRSCRGTDTGLRVDGTEIRVMPRRIRPSLPGFSPASSWCFEVDGPFPGRENAPKHLRGRREKGLSSSLPPRRSRCDVISLGVNFDYAYDPRTSSRDLNASCHHELAWLRSPRSPRHRWEQARLMTTIHAYTSDQRLQTSRTKTSSAPGRGDQSDHPPPG